MGNMTQEELEKLHGVLLDMMCQFDRVCRENDISYFLGGGTLLGAIRHGGFIPWDDDADLMMTRENYDKLCALPRSAFPEGWFLQTYKTDPHYHGDMAKIRLDGTAYSTEFSNRFPEMHQGIFLDIFAHDRTAKNKKMQKIHIFCTTLIRSMIFHKWEGTPMHFYGKYKLVCAVFTGLIRILPMRLLEKIREWIYRWYEKSDSPYFYDGMGMHLQHGAFSTHLLDRAEYRAFAGQMLPVPERFDEYLTFSYGDYMRLPSEEDRRLHSIFKLDFGDDRGQA